MQYGYLLIAVALEVSGTMLLPVSQNFTRPVPTRVPDWVLRGVFLLPDLRPEYVADRGGLRHVVWAGHFSDHVVRIPGVRAGTGLARHCRPAADCGGGGAGE